MRNLPDVIDQILAVAPDLEPCLSDAKSSAMYSSPEMEHFWWQEVSDVLNDHAESHSKAKEIAAIWNDTGL